MKESSTLADGSSDPTVARPGQSSGAPAAALADGGVVSGEMISQATGEWARADVAATLRLEARQAAQITKVAGGTLVRDLILLMPNSYTDRRRLSSTNNFVAGEINTFKGRITEIRTSGRRGSPTRITFEDHDGAGDIVVFHGDVGRRYLIGEEYLISGVCKSTLDRVEMVHPDLVLPIHKAGEMPWIDPVWPLAAGISRQLLGKVIRRALAEIPCGPEWIHEAVLTKYNWPSFREAICAVQAPSDLPNTRARERLAYDEAFSRAVAFGLMRRASKAVPGRVFMGCGRLRAGALAAFGHALTHAQEEALAEILNDMAAPRRMARLLQGDVGAGKTIIALLAMLAANECGAQAALLAPTELLASQHYQTFTELAPVAVVLLVGEMSKAQRREALRRIRTGEAKIIVGTHALFQKEVQYQDLGLIVIDEQHRFGVEHRARFAEKGSNADQLHMTATPIPRTLALANLGWMDFSVVRGKPAGRKPVLTTLTPMGRLTEVLDAVGRIVASGGRVYWVCPAVTEDVVTELAAAEERFRSLHSRYGKAVALVHGQQSPEERRSAVNDFRSGRYSILVGTTVIEVGVDVPDANVMIIEHAERFGAAQLHQLRGRIGRGNAQSYCVLLHADGMSRQAFKRLRLLKRSNDGFEIAEEDFRLRGGGDVMGANQSGFPDYRVLNLETDAGIIDLADRDARHFLSADPELKSDRAQAVLLCLEVFGASRIDK